MAQREAGQSLIDFSENFGVPEMLLTDGYGEFTGWNTKFVKHDRRIRMQLQNSEQGRHNHNHAIDSEIGFLAKCWRK